VVAGHGQGAGPGAAAGRHVLGHHRERHRHAGARAAAEASSVTWIMPGRSTVALYARHSCRRTPSSRRHRRP
jgi:hypothetical protein